LDQHKVKFIDEVELKLASGKGGAGCVSFRREKFVPLGGPNGGDGGDGGDVTAVADRNMSTLLDFRHQKLVKAENGRPGEGSDRHGRNGKNVELRLPIGTEIRDAETGDLLADLTEDEQRAVILAGGKGGRGNARFSTSTNRAPTYAQPGMEGEEKKVRLQLKLMADVGLVGFPNAGKSTLISRISASKPKIADYPFTTLAPNLGVVSWGEYKSYVVADLPGLIEGAHKGVGLGIKFLKHIERTRLLLHLVDPVDGEDALEKYNAIRNELISFDPSLGERAEVVVITKIDALGGANGAAETVAQFRAKGVEPLVVSAATGEGIPALISRVGQLVENLKRGPNENDD